MDSTTVYLMRQAALANRRTADSLERHADSVLQAGKDAARAAAEAVLFRHDLVLLGMVTIPSLAFLIAFLIYIKKSQ